MFCGTDYESNDPMQGKFKNSMRETVWARTSLIGPLIGPFEKRG